MTVSHVLFGEKSLASATN